MISLCSVTLKTAIPYLTIMEEWIVKRTTLVKEVLWCKVDEGPSFYKEWTNNGIVFKHFGPTVPPHKIQVTPGHQHAIGLHACIDIATYDKVLLVDPDIFFYDTGVDRLWDELMTKYDLDVIGASHYSATELAMTFFPWNGCLLTKKHKLPDKEFLRGHLAIEGYYMLMGEVEGFTEMFPNPKGNFGTGVYLWLWAHEQNWKWLSFQTTDVFSYSTNYNRSNIKITDKIPKQKLIYHGVSGTIKPAEVFDRFKTKYEESSSE